MASTGMQSHALQQPTDGSRQPNFPQAIGLSLISRQDSLLDKPCNCDTTQEFQDRTRTEARGGFGLEALVLEDASPSPQSSPALHEHPIGRAGLLGVCHAAGSIHGPGGNARAPSAAPIEREGRLSKHPQGCTGTANRPISPIRHVGIHGAQGGHEARCSVPVEQRISTEGAASSGCAPPLGPDAGNAAGESLAGSWAVWEDEARQVMDWAGLDLDWLRTDLLPYAESIIGSLACEANQPVSLRKGRRYGWHQRVNRTGTSQAAPFVDI